MKDVVVARAPGKMMWLGEYVVLDGAPAVVAAVDRFARASWQPGGDRLELRTQWNSEESGAPAWPLWDGGWQTPTDKTRLVDAVLRELHDRLSWKPTPGLLTLDTGEMSAGHKLGLGSSGAVAAIVATLFGGEASDSVVEEVALAGHDRFQGRVGSGSDVRASLHGGLVIVNPGAPTTACSPPPGLRFAAIDTGEPADTRKMVRGLKQWRAAVGRSSTLEEMAEVARRGARAVEASDTDAFVQSAQRFGTLEAKLTAESGVPIVSASVARAMGAAADAGWVAKPSGAGGGDVVVAFGGADASTDRLRETTLQAGLEVVELGIAPSGSLACRVTGDVRGGLPS